MKNSNCWSQATQNPFKAIGNLISCLQSGNNAWIERQENGKQSFPLVEDNPDLNKMECWDCSTQPFSSDWEKTKKEILDTKRYLPIEKKLMTEYTLMYGSQEEYDSYLKTGIAKFGGIGKRFFVKYDDLIKIRTSQGIEMDTKTRFYPMVLPIPRYKLVKKLKRKVFVIMFNDEKQTIPLWVKVINVLTYPLKFVPKKSVLRMKEYTNYTFSIGSVFNGYSIEFSIPKKFSFK